MEYYEKKYLDWMSNSFFDNETKKELKDIEGNLNEIKERFYKDLEFGTAGLRGIVGVGTNRMNKYTVGKVTQGLANYIIKKRGGDKGFAIAYDCRNMSKEFGEQTALILNANGIKTYIFDSLRPTPELSYAIRKLGCISGVVITASHNPPEYNGYKAYWSDGAQISDPIDKEISEEIANIKDFSLIKTMAKEEAKEEGLYNIIGKEIDDAYINEVKKLSLNKDIKKDIKVVYTPLHGTAGALTKRLLEEEGFLFIKVPEQFEPDAKFPTVEYPNPEDLSAFKLALEKAKKENADIVIANDPDGDRIGLHVKDQKTGQYILFNGNMIGLIIAEYLISQKKEKEILPKNSALIKTIVSSNMTDEICRQNGVKLFEVLTGFKNIASKIKEFEKDNSYINIMGFEESYGCLLGDHARDKDGIAAAFLLCEAAAYYKGQNLTLWDKFQQMYEKYGYFKEDQISITLKGFSGAEQIKNIMKKIREKFPVKIDEYIVLKVRDYSNNTIIDMVKKEKINIELPFSDVIYFELENDAWSCIRPSGTEPKIKIYAGVKANDICKATKKIKDLLTAMEKLIN